MPRKILRSDLTNTSKESQQSKQQKTKSEETTMPRELTHHRPTIPVHQSGSSQNGFGSHPPRPSIHVLQKVHGPVVRDDEDNGPLLGMFSSSNKHDPWAPQHHPRDSVLSHDEPRSGDLKRRVTDTLPSKEARDRAARRYNSGGAYASERPSTAQAAPRAEHHSTRPSTSNGFGIRRKPVASPTSLLNPKQQQAEIVRGKHADVSRKPLPQLPPKVSIHQNGQAERVNIPEILGAPDGGYSQKYPGQNSRFMEKFAAVMLKEAKEFDKRSKI